MLGPGSELANVILNCKIITFLISLIPGLIYDLQPIFLHNYKVKLQTAPSIFSPLSFLYGFLWPWSESAPHSEKMTKQIEIIK